MEGLVLMGQGYGCWCRELWMPKDKVCTLRFEACNGIEFDPSVWDHADKDFAALVIVA